MTRYGKLKWDRWLTHIECSYILYAGTSHYLHKTVLYLCKRTVLKVLCYQNIYAVKHWGKGHALRICWVDREFLSAVRLNKQICLKTSKNWWKCWIFCIKMYFSLFFDDCIYCYRPVVVTLNTKNMVRIIQQSVKYTNWTLKGQV